MGEIEEEVALSPLTTFKIGGNARFFIRTRSTEDLERARLFAINSGDKGRLPIFILGGGSNVLISDEGFPGLIIKMEIKGVEWLKAGKGPGAHRLVRAWAGENWDDIVKEAVAQNLWGIENLSGIPGTVGASVIQNIGAYGSEIKSIVESVETFNLENGEVKIFNNKDCQFEYRESVFKKTQSKKLVVTRVTYRLSSLSNPNLSYKDLKSHFQNEFSPTISEIREAVLQIRSRKFPNLTRIGTAGSFFKNPLVSIEEFQVLAAKYPDIPHWKMGGNRMKIPAAWLIDVIGKFRGTRLGDVGSHKDQSLVIVNFGKATAQEVKKFTQVLKNKIKDETKINLEEEVQFI